MKSKVLIVITVLLLGLSFSVYAAIQPPNDIEWLPITMGLFGGLALFLSGLEQLADGLKKAAGETLRLMLAKLTTNRFMGAVTGAVITGILNSSSITTVLVVGFVTAGMMTLTQSVGVIMGANIGSTATAQILAFNVSAYALIPIAVGFFMLFSAKNEKVTYYGMMLMGLGLVFYGMGLMSDAMRPLREYQPFLDILQKMDNPVLGLLAGALFTGLVQSSAATVGIAIAMAAEGLLSLQGGITLALGANIGTCVTALMAALGKPPEAVRAATVHIVFNIVGVLLWFFFIDDLARIVSTPLSDTALMASERAESVPRQIANANTLFNIVNTIVFLPFAPLFARFATMLVPERQVVDLAIKPLYLDEKVLDIPTIALDRARQELGRAVEVILDMFEKLESSLSSADMASIKSLVRDDDDIDVLEEATIDYLGKIRRQSLSATESDELRALMTSAITLETLADVIEQDLVRLAEKTHASRHKSSPETVMLIQQLYLRVVHSVRQLQFIIRKKDDKAIERLMDEEVSIREIHNKILVRKAARLGSLESDALKMARIEVSVADKLTRIYSLAKRIALENKNFGTEDNGDN